MIEMNLAEFVIFLYLSFYGAFCLFLFVAPKIEEKQIRNKTKKGEFLPMHEKSDLSPKRKGRYKKCFRRKTGAETPVNRRYVPPPSIKTVKSEGMTLDPCPEIETKPVPMSTANTLRE